MRKIPFQSTPPVKAATFLPEVSTLKSQIISIHAAREGGDPELALLFHVPNISIHAAREGGDVKAFSVFIGRYISIHAAREGGDRLNQGY